MNECVKEDQHAYKEKDSAEIALIKIINNITEQINKEPSTIRILLVDIRKAFDSVEHPLLLHAMEERVAVKVSIATCHEFIRS